MTRITLRNITNEVVRMALFKRPVLNPMFSLIAWRVVSPPPGGMQTIEIPSSFSVFGQYSTDRQNPSNLTAETAHVSFAETTARFSIDAVTLPDQRASGAVIHQHFDGLVQNELRITNNYGLGVLTTLAVDGDAVFDPQVIWPGGVFLEDVRGDFFVAVVSPFTTKGQRLAREEVSQTETQVIDGDSIILTGSMWTGYRLSNQR